MGVGLLACGVGLCALLLRLGNLLVESFVFLPDLVRTQVFVVLPDEPLQTYAIDEEDLKRALLGLLGAAVLVQLVERRLSW